jgi:dTDP-4-amino-4,6-dideoxygalactose transaminase
VKVERVSISSFLLPADPKANYLAHRGEINQAIQRVLERGCYILGEEVSAFEHEFARYLGVRSVVGVGNGTDALHLALRACGIGPNDSVITVSHTAVAPVAAIELAGATAVLVDINPETYTIDPHRVEDVIAAQLKKSSIAGGRLKAIIPVHLYGHPADMPAIMDIARRYDLYIIEDCAQSHGATIDGRKTGTWGHLAAFSFYPTKNLGALGDGGAVVSNDPAFGERVRLLREYGWKKRYISDFPGLNSRLDELQAAILRVKLKYIDEENARRRDLAHIYGTLLSGTSLILPRVKAGVNHVYHQYVVLSKHRNNLKSFLEKNSVGTLIHYPVPVHLQPAYQGRVVISKRGLEHTERVCQEILSLPIYPQMSNEQIKRVSELITLWNRQMDKD